MSGSEVSRRSATGSSALTVAVAVLIVVPVLVVLGLRTAGDASAPTAVPASSAADPETASTDQPEALSERATPGRNRALFFGDSYFIGGGYTDKRHSMASIASRRLGYVPRITGGGGTGFTAANPQYALPPYLGQIAEGALRARKPEWVVIEGGLNDRSSPKSQIRRNARKVLRIAMRKHPDAHVVLVGPVDTDGQLADTRPVMRALRRAAKLEGVPFVNAQRWLVGRYDLIGADYVHPTPEGHRLLGRRLARALRVRGA